MANNTKKTCYIFTEKEIENNFTSVSFPQFSLGGSVLQCIKAFKYLGHMIRVHSRLGVLETWVLVSRRLETRFYKSWSRSRPWTSESWSWSWSWNLRVKYLGHMIRYMPGAPAISVRNFGVCIDADLYAVSRTKNDIAVLCRSLINFVRSDDLYWRSRSRC